jgi:DNA-binding CsgD family transcriptional regulator/tetratricopeptide (TPR) repeat protein
MLSRHLDEAIAHAEEARRLAAPAGDEAVARNATVTLAACLPFAGRVDEGFALLEATIGEARATHAEAEASRGYRMIGSCASVTVEYERGERFLRDGIAYAERAERWNDRHYMAAHLGHVLWATGRWTEARSVAEQALQDGRGGITTRITALHVAGYAALGRGDWAAATGALDEARIEGERMGELQRLSPALWGLAEAALLQGDAASAVRWSDMGLAASLEVRDAAYLYPFAVTGTRARLGTHDPAGAARFAAAVEDELLHRSIPGTLPAIDHARGLLALAAGQTGEARRLLERAADAWDGRKRAWEASWARLDLSRALLRSNRRADALRHVAAVEARAAELGSEPLAEAARAIRGSGRGGDASPWSPLTGRELEVAVLVADGLTNGEIADRLGVAPKTVSAHVEHILAKLGVGRRTEVAAWVATIRASRPSTERPGHTGG